MKFILQFSILLFFSFLLNQTELVAASSTTLCTAMNFQEIHEIGIHPPVGKKQKTKTKKAKPRAKEDKKPFPLFAMLSLIAGILALSSFFLGIYLSFPLYIGIIAVSFAIGALVLGIIALKKGNPKAFSFVGIMLGAMGIIGGIMFLISVLG